MYTSPAFSSPTGAFLISIDNKVYNQSYLLLFSSPTGAFLISIQTEKTISETEHVFVPYRGIPNLNRPRKSNAFSTIKVFVPYRGIPNLNPTFYIALESRLPNMVCGGNRKPRTTSLYNQLLLSATPYFQGIGAKWHINYEFCMLIRPIPISYSSPLYLVHLHTCGAKCSCRFL